MVSSTNIDPPRRAWLDEATTFVERVGVVSGTLIFSSVAILASTVLCHGIYWLFDLTPSSIELALPTLAPAIVAPPVVFILVKTIERLAEVERSKAHFLSSMSHELRTPLNAILGFSESMRDRHLSGGDVPAESGYAADIHESGRHILALVDDILDISRIEAGRMDLTPEWQDVEALVGEVILMVRGDAARKGVALDWEGVSSGTEVFGDERAIKQVLLNLLSNAIKFTGSGGRIIVSALESTEEGIVFRVTDTGLGIAEADLAEIFEPFSRARNLTEEAQAGTGLGLSLSKGLVGLHRGTIRITSKLGEGTIATASFPSPQAKPAAAE